MTSDSYKWDQNKSDKENIDGWINWYIEKDPQNNKPNPGDIWIIINGDPEVTIFFYDDPVNYAYVKHNSKATKGQAIKPSELIKTMNKRPLFIEYSGKVGTNPDIFEGVYLLDGINIPGVISKALIDFARVERKPRTDTMKIYGAVLKAFDTSGIPMTVRQVYYALVSLGAIPKTKAAYIRVCYHLLNMRRQAVIPYDFIADNTRWMRKPNTYRGLDQFLEITKRAYRRMLWADQDVYIEVWVEKDALAGVLYEVTAPWDVPLMVTRGYPSDTFLFDAAEALKNKDKPCHIYYFGDRDPSGVDIATSTARKLREFGATFTFHWEAVTQEQIKRLNLPTRPTKKSDTRAKGWEGGSVELDAIPANTLRAMVQEVIEGHIDPTIYNKTRQAEALERETLEKVLNTLG